MVEICPARTPDGLLRGSSIPDGFRTSGLSTHRVAGVDQISGIHGGDEGSHMRKVFTAATLAMAGVLLMLPVSPAQARPGHFVALASVASVKAASSPTLSSFTPSKGPMGTRVTITGSGFVGTTMVTFHGVTAVFRVVSNTRISATVPCGTATGRVRVTGPRGTAVSTTSFRIT
jgi:hypothetical protein